MNELSLAGVARAEITPPIGVMLEAYHREEPSTGVLDPLYATALALRAGESAPVLLLAIDNVGLLVAETDAIRQAIAAATGLSLVQIMVLFDHTHSGPRATPQTLRQIEQGALEAAERALKEMQPAQVGWGIGHVEAGVNRRVPSAEGVAVMGANWQAPTDPRLGVLRVDDAAGKPLAALILYAAHGNVLKVDSNLISADWPGAARQVIESALGCPALIGLLACGNINARWRGSVDALKRMGLAIGGEALKVCAQIETAPLSRAKMRAQTISLRLKSLPDEREAERLAAEAGQRWEVNTDDWLAEVRARLRRGETEPSVSLLVHALHVNEGALVGIPMEPFVEIGLAVASRFPGQPVFFTGYTDGWIGYLPIPEAYTWGGYEVEWAPVVYGVGSGWVRPARPEMASAVIAAAIELAS
jgi:hypothetical protein